MLYIPYLLPFSIIIIVVVVQIVQNICHELVLFRCFCMHYITRFMHGCYVVRIDHHVSVLRGCNT